MKPESDSTPETPSPLDTLLQEAKGDTPPVVAGRMRAKVLNTLEEPAPRRRSPTTLLAVGAAACLLLAVSLGPHLLPSASDPGPETGPVDPASVAIQWVHGTSPEHVTPAVRVAITELYRQQQVTFQQDVNETLQFLQRALPL